MNVIGPFVSTNVCSLSYSHFLLYWYGLEAIISAANLFQTYFASLLALNQCYAEIVAGNVCTLSCVPLVYLIPGESSFLKICILLISACSSSYPDY